MSHRPLQPAPADPDHPGSSSPSPGGLVQAAGAICWRTTERGELELLMVRSARWGDWAWPKGKLEPNETLPGCAVREVAEETGARIELGVPLPLVEYVLPEGQDKRVHYWVGRVLATGPRTAPQEEIADVQWLGVEAALERLTQPGDLAPVQALIDLAGRRRLDTRPLLVVRHAKARKRQAWRGEEADRPLTATGLRQGRALAPLLACWHPDRVLSSPWARCMQTLSPYLDLIEEQDHTRTEPEVLGLLSEHGLRNDPRRVAKMIDELLYGHRGALVCTHRPVLAGVIAALRDAATLAAAGQLPEADPWLAPGQILVAHVSTDVQHDGGQRINAVEVWSGASPRKRRYRERPDQ